VERLSLCSAGGLRATLLSYGATLAALELPARHGAAVGVVLGFDALEAYLHARGAFGGTIGRFANRIAGGRFVLDDQTYTLSANEGGNTLHGGAHGFHRAVWTVDSLEGGDRPYVEFRHVSPDGDQGFPGELDVRVRYTVAPDSLRIDYVATTDRPTVVNLTNHVYFNLAGAGSGDVLGHEVTIDAEQFLPVDRELIPTGEWWPVAGTPFDFRTPQTIGARITEAEPQLVPARGYDHTFVLTRRDDDALALAARVREPRSGRTMDVWTTEPGVQFYTGNNLDGSAIGAEGRPYHRRHGFCLETQHFPDSPNRPGFPSTVLRPGATFRSTTLLRFSGF
ncbi:MAG: galactose mutarotase, partial [Alphaproteobacteria bacterium]|nr:galactose mutarotase [Alphaproteobacteria bacterium]